MAAVQQSISYKHELLAGDIVEVGSRVLEAGASSLRFVHEMRNAASGEIASVCELVGVHIDRSMRKACPLPPAVQEALRAELAAIGSAAESKAGQSSAV